ncbi:hypothetical protein SAMN05216428_102392 [Nitrosospira sp. Nsp11]|uniref:hypothetical protein n=1 Tax=Nitrosospira sp. Nsp11 TaxID=1855338 RepID=UPI00091D906E|nr:hypothetical protein [Nitrosospira sp. Nsp11]SHL43315.1 hypothetical protein SAMN05216428_102392 [Nitrosospira sp. Nsp11]
MSKSKGATAPAVKPALKLATPSLKLASTLAPKSDYVDSMRELLRRAERGENIGLAYVEINSNKTFSTEAIGIAGKSTLSCLGMIETLKAKLLKKVLA